MRTRGEVEGLRTEVSVDVEESNGGEGDSAHVQAPVVEALDGEVRSRV